MTQEDILEARRFYADRQTDRQTDNLNFDILTPATVSKFTKNDICILTGFNLTSGKDSTQFKSDFFIDNLPNLRLISFSNIGIDWYSKTSKWRHQRLKQLFKDTNARLGFRDYDKLKEYNFKNSYLSLCLTLTLDERDQDKEYSTLFLNEHDNWKNIVNDQDICLSNYGALQNAKISKIKHITSELKGILTNDVYKNEEIAQTRLDELKDNAAFVYTMRLHIFLPCLAMGIPVKYVGPIDYRTRTFVELFQNKKVNVKEVKELVEKNFYYQVFGEGEDVTNYLNDLKKYL